MSKNENQDFDKNLKEIKELSEKLEESLKMPHIILYHDKKQEKKKMNVNIQIINMKEEGNYITLMVK